MIEPQVLDAVRALIATRAEEDQELLGMLREEARRLRDTAAPIRPRSTTAVSLVASDGGNNALHFDPLLIQLVRVVDSKGKQLCLDVISQKTDIASLSKRVLDEGERNALAVLMNDLNIKNLWDLSPMIPSPARQKNKPEEISPSWVQVYRDLCEWAVLYRLITRTTFGSSTLIVRDGLLKSKIFARSLFIEMCERIESALKRLQDEERSSVWLVGVAKHSKLIERYRLAMALEHVFPAGQPAYVAVPDDLALKAVQWPEYVRPPVQEEGKEAPKFNYGSLHLVRFGKATGDPTWVVDIFYPQRSQTAQIMGYLLEDAINGFPVPFYPRCLQRAHEHAQLVGLDMDILESEIYKALRDRLRPEERHVLDTLRLNPDPARLRYEQD